MLLMKMGGRGVSVGDGSRSGIGSPPLDGGVGALRMFRGRGGSYLVGSKTL